MVVEVVVLIAVGIPPAMVQALVSLPTALPIHHERAMLQRIPMGATHHPLLAVHILPQELTPPTLLMVQATPSLISQILQHISL